MILMVVITAVIVMIVTVIMNLSDIIDIYLKAMSITDNEIAMLLILYTLENFRLLLMANSLQLYF